MANGRIENKDLFAPDLGKGTLDTFQAMLKTANEYEKTQQLILKNNIAIQKNPPRNLKEVNEFNNAVVKQKTIIQNLDKVDKQRQTTLQKISTLESKRGRQLEKTKLELQKVRRETKQSIKENSSLSSSYEKATAKLNRLGKELKEVAFKEGANAKATRKLGKEYDKLRTKVFNAEKVAGEFQRNVGNYPNVLGKATQALRNMGLAFGGLAVIRNVFNTVKDFEQSIANLSAITGATGDDLDFLKSKAIELGSSTTLSATQVAEGFKLIASAKPELLENAEALSKVTESTIVLAEAAGIELPEAASALANSLNQFGEGAEAAAKFVDTLAAGSKFGAGDINFLNEALVSSGTVAKDAGLGIQETVAALELFAEKGIPASKAGNSFKNVLLNLQKSGKGFVNGKFNLQAAISQINKELDEIQDPAKKASKQINLFGKENITTGKILLQNNGRLAEMTEKVDENGIALEQQAKNNDTLQGAIKALSSAWEGMILNLEKGTGAFGYLKDILFFVADNLELIIKLVGSIGGAFLVYKTINKTTKAFKALSVAMRANPYALIATAIIALTVVIADWAKEMTTAEKIQQNLIDVQKEAAKSVAAEKAELDTLLIVAKDKTQSDEDRLAAIQKLNDISPEYLGNLTLETINTEEGTAAIESYIKALDEKAYAQAIASKKEELYKQLIDESNKTMLESVTTTDLLVNSLYALGNTQEAVNSLAKDALDNSKNNKKAIEDQIEALNNLIKTKVKEGDVDSVLNKSADEELSKSGLIADKRKEIADENKKITEATTILEIRSSQKRVKQLQKELDHLLGVNKKKKESTSEYKSFFAEAVAEDIALEKERNDELEFEYNKSLLEYDEFIEEDKRLKKKRLDDNLEFTSFFAEAIADEIAIEEELRAKQIADREKFADALSKGAGVVTDIMQEEADKRIALLDKELAANKAFQEAIIANNKKGVLSTEENLAFEKKKQAELELAKQKQAEAEAKRELIVTAVETYSSYVQSGKMGGQALASTVTDINVLKSFIGTLDLFKDGSDDIGTVANPLDSDGGRAIIAHDNEQIWSKQNVKDGGNRTRKQAIEDLNAFDSLGLGSKYSNGNSVINYAMELHRFQSNTDVLAKFDKLEQAVNNIDIPTTSFHYDSINESFVKKIETSRSIERIHERKSNLF